MISTTGNLTTSDGLTFINPLINICIIDGSKFQPLQAVLYIGKIEQGINPDQTTTPFFKSSYELLTLNYNIDGYSFEEVQSMVINDLSNLFLNCTFEKS